MTPESESPVDAQDTLAPSPPVERPDSNPGGLRNGSVLSRRLGLAANLGALVGLFLVVLQLQQSRKVARAQIRHDLAMGIVELLNVPAADSQLASVLRRGAAGEDLAPDERYQFQLRSNALLRYWENVHYQFRQGLYDEVEYSRSVGLVAYWCEVRSLYSPSFAADLNSMVPSPGCP
jgi:hypothetical protein